jgi:hypothetical protein
MEQVTTWQVAGCLLVGKGCEPTYRLQDIAMPGEELPVLMTPAPGSTCSFLSALFWAEERKVSGWSCLVASEVAVSGTLGSPSRMCHSEEAIQGRPVASVLRTVLSQLRG